MVKNARPTKLSTSITLLVTTWLLATARNQIHNSCASSCPHKCLCNGRIPLNCAYQDLESISLTEYDGTIFDGADFTGANLHHAHLASLSLKNAIFNDANLGDATLDMADLQGASFRRANLTGSILSGANMKFADFTGAEMIHVEASGKKTRLDDAILDGVNARYGVFSGMIGPRVSLDSADMSFTNLVHTKISNAYLFDTVFRGSNLRDADLSGAVMDNANFYGARTNGVKWGLPSSVENSGSEDALSEELVIDPMINEMIPNSGILDQPSALYTDYKPTMGLDEMDQIYGTATEFDHSDDSCPEALSEPSNLLSSVLSILFTLATFAVMALAFVAIHGFYNERETKTSGEQAELLELRSGAPASLVAKDSAPSEPEILNRAEPIGFNILKKNTEPVGGSGNESTVEDEGSSYRSKATTEIHESFEENGTIEESQEELQTLDSSYQNTKQEDESWMYDLPDSCPSTAKVNGQSRNSDYFVGPPKSPWKGSQSEHDSISLGIRHLVRSENESSENETAIDDGMDCIGTVLKDLQLTRLRLKGRARAAEQCVNSMTSLQVLPSVKKPARGSHYVSTPRIADCAKSLTESL